MENKQCNKCKNKVLCKFADNLDKVEETFPFIESFTCRFYDSGKQVKESAFIKTEEQVKEKKAPIKEDKELAKEMNIPVEDKPKKSRKSLEQKSPSTSAVEAFRSLGIESLKLNASINNELVKIGIRAIGDLYKPANSKMIPKDTKKIINDQLLIFNQNPIK